MDSRIPARPHQKQRLVSANPNIGMPPLAAASKSRGLHRPKPAQKIPHTRIIVFAQSSFHLVQRLFTQIKSAELDLLVLLVARKRLPSFIQLASRVPRSINQVFAGIW